MREIRTSGSEGGGTDIGPPYPYPYPGPDEVSKTRFVHLG